MDDWQKAVLGLLFLILIAVAYAAYRPIPVQKTETIREISNSGGGFSTGASSSFTDFQSTRAILNSSANVTYQGGDQGSNVPTRFYKEVLEIVRVNATSTNVSITIIDSFNNRSIYNFAGIYINGTNVTRSLNIPIYGYVYFNVTGGATGAWNGTLVTVDLITRGA